MAEVLPPPRPEEWPDLTEEHLFDLAPRDRLLRVYSSRGPHPSKWHEFRRWGPTTARFDHHPVGPRKIHQSHAVWYGAIQQDSDEEEGKEPLKNGLGLATAVTERFQSSRKIPVSDSTMSIVICQSRNSVKLLDLESGWITQVGGNRAIGSGSRSRAREWARAINQRYPDLPGVVWHSSVYPPGRAVALWDCDRDFFRDRPLLNRTLPEMTPYLVTVSAHTHYDIVD